MSERLERHIQARSKVQGEGSEKQSNSLSRESSIKHRCTPSLDITAYIPGTIPTKLSMTNDKTTKYHAAN